MGGEICDLAVGNTETAAGMVRVLTQADLFRIEPVRDHSPDICRCIDETREGQWNLVQFSFTALTSGEFMADIVRDSGYGPGDFFIFTASGSEDFAYSGFKSGVLAMGETDVFTFADSEQEGNLSFREREGYAHDGRAANEYMYNALRLFWNP